MQCLGIRFRNNVNVVILFSGAQGRVYGMLYAIAIYSRDIIRVHSSSIGLINRLPPALKHNGRPFSPL